MIAFPYALNKCSTSVSEKAKMISPQLNGAIAPGYKYPVGLRQVRRDAAHGGRDASWQAYSSCIFGARDGDTPSARPHHAASSTMGAGGACDHGRLSSALGHVRLVGGVWLSLHCRPAK